MIELKANVPDSPGTLISLLKPISDNAGNIASVIHSHEEKRSDKIPVIVRFGLPTNVMEEKLKIITEELKKMSIDILEITEVLHRENITLIITGHVFETDFVDTYKRIAQTGAHITKIEALFTNANDVSNVKFEIKCDKALIRKTMDEIHKICREKNLTFITDQ